jgi:hypothetical protein
MQKKNHAGKKCKSCGQEMYTRAGQPVRENSKREICKSCYNKRWYQEVGKLVGYAVLKKPNYSLVSMK